jgi:hypothetical protein
MRVFNLVVSLADKIREESQDLCRNLKEDFIIPKKMDFDFPKEDEDEQREREHFEFLCWSYGLKEPSYDDFKAFIEQSHIEALNYSRSEYMIHYISNYKAKYQRDSISNKRITFLKFCVSKDIFFTETFFRDYLFWSDENCKDTTLSRWQKMQKYYLTMIVYYNCFDLDGKLNNELS